MFFSKSVMAMVAPSNPNPIEESQPDGNVVQLFLKGHPHSGAFLTDAAGHPVLRDDQGWYTYASYEYEYDTTIGGRRKLIASHRRMEDGAPNHDPPDLTTVRHDPNEEVFQATFRPPPFNGTDELYRNTTTTDLVKMKDLLCEGMRRSPWCPNNPQTLENLARTDVLPQDIGGQLNIIVVLIRFSDHTDRTLLPKSHYETFFNSNDNIPDITPTGSVKKYYNTASNGKYHVVATVEDWTTIPETEEQISFGKYGLTGQYGEAANAALQKMDERGVNWNDFDRNNDGLIDAVFIIHSGYAAEVGGTDCVNQKEWGTHRIWSHRATVSDDPTTFTSANGDVKMASYATTSGFFGTCGQNSCRIGVVCHEMGHLMGLPDMIGDEGNGVAIWDIMGQMWGVDGSQYSPGLFGAYSKQEIGWIQPIKLTENGVYNIRASADFDEAYRIDEGFPDGEYLLIENRQALYYDDKIESTGLLIWHIDENLSDPYQSRAGWPGQEGWPSNGNHYQLAVLQADRQFDLEKGTHGGGEGDLFAGPFAGLYPGSDAGIFPNSDSYSNGTIVKTGISITEISSSSEIMTFRLTIALSASESQQNSQVFLNAPISEPSLPPISMPTPVTTPSPSPDPTPPPSPSPSPPPSTNPTPIPTLTPTPRPTPIPSLEPTQQPTPVPSPGPTPVPTSGPTPEPSPIPTSEPIQQLTPRPSPSPTPLPSPSPTPEPSRQPTPQPSQIPTPFPSPGPTPEPTQQPTPQPSQIPTYTPTPDPTFKPTPGPTSTPTAGPTQSPTARPTSIPTAVPTPFPTGFPTLLPTPTPTGNPTNLAKETLDTEGALVDVENRGHPQDSLSWSALLADTESPSAGPTEILTLLPKNTSMPAPSPPSQIWGVQTPALASNQSGTLMPFNNSTPVQVTSSVLVFTAGPSVATPTSMPTGIVNIVPSSVPPSLPGGVPNSISAPSPILSSGIPTISLSFKSSVPTASPRGVPSMSMLQSGTQNLGPIFSSSPSSRTSGIPSKGSMSPSHVLSAVPSRRPTTHPSDQPSISQSPSMGPSDAPSSSEIPSESPSLSLNPSFRPSGSPSSGPSASWLPSSVPSHMPTNTPSSRPSRRPSLSPSTSALPSLRPSMSPTFIPSRYPTARPSATVSVKSSLHPTMELTSASSVFHPNIVMGGQMLPTESPTDFPTSTPTDSPTSSPTSYPTVSPSLLRSTIPSLVRSLSPKVPAASALSRGTISGQVMIDNNKDGIGDVPSSFTRIDLLSVTTKEAIAMMGTGLDGNFTFYEVPFGDYIIEQNIPQGYKIVSSSGFGEQARKSILVTLSADVPSLSGIFFINSLKDTNNADVGGSNPNIRRGALSIIDDKV